LDAKELPYLLYVHIINAHPAPFAKSFGSAETVWATPQEAADERNSQQSVSVLRILNRHLKWLLTQGVDGQISIKTSAVP